MSLKLVPPGRRKHGKRGPNRSYILRGTVGGERIEVDTQTTDREVAREVQRRVERELLARPDRLERGHVAFADAADLYIAWKHPRLQDERNLERLKADPLGKMMLNDITSAILVQAADRLYPGCTDATKNRNVMTPAAAVLHYAAENKLCDYIRIHKFEEVLPAPRAVDAAVAELLVSNATGPLKLLLIWLFTVGTRITETLSVQRENIDMKARTFKMTMAKPDRTVTLPLPAEVIRLLPRDLGVGPLFPWKDKDAADWRLKKLCRPLGINFTFHQGRHTFATEIVNAGETLDHLPHWKDAKSRARYGRPSVERLRRVMERAGANWGQKRKTKGNQ